ncbi:hypothetical protein MUK42_33211 [Musa troglodytarum]|uniref:Uncharacterized protein n=1 Tax=Musa troglodytarum TaxID=320322 RepID=A0A9E7GRE4_9LILI|nr:hypothetical protein MUK42_33211 [Musa troglodytarum]
MMGFFPPSASGFATSTTRSTSHRPLIRLGSEEASGREGVRSIVPRDGLMRGSLSKVCFAKELQRNGLGYVIVTKSKTVASFCGNYISSPRWYTKTKSLLGNLDLYSRMILAKSTFESSVARTSYDFEHRIETRVHSVGGL